LTEQNPFTLSFPSPGLSFIRPPAATEQQQHRPSPLSADLSASLTWPTPQICPSSASRSKVGPAAAPPYARLHLQLQPPALLPQSPDLPLEEEGKNNKTRTEQQIRERICTKEKLKSASYLDFAICAGHRR
jgi:hypothetical protein